MHCPFCHSDRHPTVLGRLGAFIWYRCVSCGMNFDREVHKTHRKAA